MLALKHEAATESYEDVEEMIASTVSRFCRKYGIADREEIESEACTHYMAAYNSFDGRVSFGHWVTYKVWKGLLETHRQRSRRARIIGRTCPADGTIPGVTPAPMFCLDDFCLDLRQDAEFVARLLLDAPRELAEHIEVPGNWQIKKIRSALRQTLIKLGWDWRRISRAYKELQGVLS